MPAKLSEAVVKQRLQQVRNLQKAHVRDLEKIASLEALVTEHESTIGSQQQQLDTQAIQIAELQTMVFGKRRQPPTGHSTGTGGGMPTAPKPPRTKDSYRRPLPPASTVTTIKSCPVSTCACGGELTGLTTQDRYVEDIPLPELTAGFVPKLVTKYAVQRGVCGRCGRPTSGRELGGAKVSLGPNIRLLVCHLVAVAGMSYHQVIQLCSTLYGLTVSDGEIAGILRSQHQTWFPSYEQLKADIQAARVVNADETPWPIQGEEGRGYAWALCDAKSPRVYFALASTRGAVHARTLFGTDFSGVRISDDYGPYRSDTLPGRQQLCWAHLYRCIRDLRFNANLPDGQLSSVTTWYEAFCDIYQDLRMYLSEPYDELVRTAQSNELWSRASALASQKPSPCGEPAKLTRLKAQLLRAGPDRLFTCLPEDTPCDNNRAERDLRQLVLKRKRSFGSQTAYGAKALSTILSLCVTTLRLHPDNYFKTLAAL